MIWIFVVSTSFRFFRYLLVREWIHRVSSIKKFYYFHFEFVRSLFFSQSYYLISFLYFPCIGQTILIPINLNIAVFLIGVKIFTLYRFWTELNHFSLFSLRVSYSLFRLIVIATVEVSLFYLFCRYACTISVCLRFLRTY